MDLMNLYAIPDKKDALIFFENKWKSINFIFNHLDYKDPNAQTSLKSIANSLQIADDQYAILEYPSNTELDFSKLTKYTESILLVFFGVIPGPDFPKNTFITIDNYQFFITDSFSVFAKDQSAKTAFWQNFKKRFQ